MIPVNYSQNYQKGTLKIDSELANLSLEDLLATRDLAFGVKLVETAYYNPFKDGVGGYELSAANSVVRSDTFQELGTGFSDNYQAVSYLDALEGVFGDTRKLGGIPTRLIKLNSGAKAAIQFILPEDYYVGDMQHKLFANLYASHDGTQGIVFNSSDIAIVCGNTLAMSKADKTLRYSARHTKNVTQRLLEIQSTVFAIQKNAELHYQFLNSAVRRNVNSAEVTAFINAILPDKEKAENTRQNKAIENRRGELNEAIGISLAERNSANATAYDLFQGATRYISYRNQGRTEDEQYQYALNSELPQNALAYIREIV